METNPNTIIADSSGLISFIILGDSNHQRAVHIMNRISPQEGQIIVSGAVLSETLNILGKKYGHAIALEAGNYFSSTPSFLFTDTQAIYITALVRFQKVQTSVSFTDCIVMATADEYETKHIFGFDECFTQGGYTLPGQ